MCSRRTVARRRWVSRFEFYTEKLGFVVATDQPFDDEQRWIELRLPNADTCLAFLPLKGTPSES